MNFALASMDALIYPFFWTWKVSYNLIRHLGGAPGSIFSIPSFQSTIGVSVFTLAPKQLARAPVLAVFFYATRLAPRLPPIFISLLFQVIWIGCSLCVTVLLVPRGQVRCRVTARVTAFHASPCEYSDCPFP